MLKKVLPLAVAALALSAGGAFAEPPIAFTEANVPGVDDSRLEPLTDTEMVSVTGRGACSLAVKGVGIFVWGVATVMRDPFGQGVGIGLFGAAGAICS
ncbi:MAG: hypothetical protein OXU63_01505 [Acidobacteriota bacterium]|nr:hypothetical protein [Acidobacteriota bacterium]